MIIQLLAKKFVIAKLLVGMVNLITPFVTKKKSALCNFFMLAISIIFFGNVILLDWLFLNAVEFNFRLLDLGRYFIALHLEPLGMIFLNLLAVLWICSLLYTIKFLTINEIRSTSYFLFFVNCCVMIGSIIALSANLFTMFVFYEILTLCTIALTAHQGSEKATKTLFFYLKTLMISSLGLFLSAIVLTYTNVGHGNFISGGLIEGYFSNTHAIILLLMFIFGNY